jgi:hypothetical protein
MVRLHDLAETFSAEFLYFKRRYHRDPNRYRKRFVRELCL